MGNCCKDFLSGQKQVGDVFPLQIASFLICFFIGFLLTFDV